VRSDRRSPESSFEWFVWRVIMQKRVIWAFIAALSIALPSCGGSSGGAESASSSTGKSYSAFHDSYKPHNRRPAPDAMPVKLMDAMPAEKNAGVMEVWLREPSQKNIKAWGIAITSLPREKAGEIMDAMDPTLVAEGLNYLVDEMALDLLYYVSESTYEKVAGNLKAMK
jgi:hypothetical protein